MVETNKQMQEVLNAFADLNPLPIEAITPEAARQLPELRDAALAVVNQHGARRLIQGVIEPVKSVEHILIPGPESLLTARIYRPSEASSLPLLLYFHGGGFVLGDLNTYDSSCRALANAAGCLVLSVAYRQAPEHPFPAAHDDAFAAYRWALKNGGSIGADPHRIAVAGESAGGNLAAAVCLMAKSRSIRQPLHQLLVYPVTDNHFDTDSYQEHADAKPLNRAMMRWFWKHYLQGQPTNEICCPLQSADLAGLAPATVITAEIDPLRSEGEHYADRLRSYDVPVHSRMFKGVTHEFFGLGSAVAEGKEAVKEAATELIRAFSESAALKEAV
jgi:acetyl esterase